MIRIPVVAALIIVTSSAFAESAPALPQPRVEKINERVYALLGPAEIPTPANRGYMVNSTVIIGERGVILIDSGFSDEIGRHIKQTIAGITNKPVTHVINTHEHGDHTLGNSAFAGAEIISSEYCREAMKTSGHEWIARLQNMTGLSFPGTKPVPATVTYKENTRTTLALQGVKMEMWVPKGSHTAGDLMVYLPDDKVLVTGDIVVNTMMPNFRDGQIRNWVATLDTIGKSSARVIVPGHGALMSVDDAKKMHQAMKAFYAGIEAGQKQWLTADDIRKDLDLGYWKNMKHFDDFIAGNIARTYAEIEAGSF